MRVEIHLTLRDYLQAFRAHLGSAYVLTPVAGTLIVVVGIVLSWLKQDPLFWIIFTALGLCLVVWRPLCLRYQFRRNRKLREPYGVTTSSDGIEFVSAHGDSRTKWTAFLHYAESDATFLLYPQPDFFFIFPKRFFPPESINEFSELVHSNLAPRSTRRTGIRVLAVWVILALSIYILIEVIRASAS